MSATFRGVRRFVGASIATAVILSALAAPAGARPTPGSEFDRITADLRAAVQRHDPRSYHAFQSQLEALILDGDAPTEASDGTDRRTQRPHTGQAWPRGRESQAGAMQRDLVVRAREGDHDAFSELAAGSIERLVRLARLIVRDPDRADDAVQEALVTAWLDIRGLRDPDRFDAWLYRVLVRACYRTARRDRRRSAAEVPLLPIDAGTEADSEQTVALRDQLDRGFRRLPVDQRAVLVLHHYLSLPDREAADDPRRPDRDREVAAQPCNAPRSRAALEAEERKPASDRSRSHDHDARRPRRHARRVVRARGHGGWRGNDPRCGARADVPPPAATGLGRRRPRFLTVGTRLALDPTDAVAARLRPGPCGAAGGDRRGGADPRRAAASASASPLRLRRRPADVVRVRGGRLVVDGLPAGTPLTLPGDGWYTRDLPNRIEFRHLPMTSARRRSSSIRIPAADAAASEAARLADAARVSPTALSANPW